MDIIISTLRTKELKLKSENKDFKNSEGLNVKEIRTRATIPVTITIIRKAFSKF